MEEEMKKEVAPSEQMQGPPQLTEAQLQKLATHFGCSVETLGETIDALPAEEMATEGEEEKMARSMFPSLNQ
jgi:hypothetical protein